MGCKSCSKTVLLLVNAIFLVVGLIVLGVGIWVIVDSNVFLQTIAKIPITDGSAASTYGKLIDDAAYILIATGGAVTLISFLGCCGAMKSSGCLLIIYSVLLGILVLAEVACIILATFFYNHLETFLQGNLIPYLAENYENNVKAINATQGVYRYNTKDALSRGIDAFQVGFRCCGLTGVEDYGDKISYTCCDVKYDDDDEIINNIWGGNPMLYFTNPACPQSNDTTLANRYRPCKTAMLNYIEEKSLIFIGVAAGVVGFELLGIIMACSLWCAKRKEDKY